MLRCGESFTHSLMVTQLGFVVSDRHSVETASCWIYALPVKGQFSSQLRLLLISGETFRFPTALIRESVMSMRGVSQALIYNANQSGNGRKRVAIQADQESVLLPLQKTRHL